MHLQPGTIAHLALTLAEVAGFSDHLHLDRVGRVAEALEGSDLAAEGLILAVVRRIVIADAAGDHSIDLAVGLAKLLAHREGLPIDFGSPDASSSGPAQLSRPAQLSLLDAMPREEPRALPRILLCWAGSNQDDEESILLSDYARTLEQRLTGDWLEVVWHPGHRDHSTCELVWEADLVVAFVYPGSTGVGAQVTRLRALGALILLVARHHVDDLSFVFASPDVGSTLPVLRYDRPDDLKCSLTQVVLDLQPRLNAVSERRIHLRAIWQPVSARFAEALSRWDESGQVWPESMPVSESQARTAAVRPLALAGLAAEQLRSLDALLDVDLSARMGSNPTQDLEQYLPESSRKRLNAYCERASVSRSERLGMVRLVARRGMDMMYGVAARHTRIQSEEDWKEIHNEVRAVSK